MSHRHPLLLAAAAMALGTGAAAPDSRGAPDAELLEFLGSLDADEEADWWDFLADRPARSAAGKPASRATGAPTPARPSPGPTATREATAPESAPPDTKKPKTETP